jgi:hypothetical protein
LVSVLCLNAQETVLFSCSLYLQSRKVKLSLGFINEAPHHGDVLWSGDIATPFLTLSIHGGELSASCLCWAALVETALYRTLVWLQSCSQHNGKLEDLMPLLGIPPWLFSHQSSCLVPVLTELSQLVLSVICTTKLNRFTTLCDRHVPSP